MFTTVLVKRTISATNREHMYIYLLYPKRDHWKKAENPISEGRTGRDISSVYYEAYYSKNLK